MKKATPASTIANSDALALCDAAAPTIGLCEGELPVLVPLPPVVPFEAAVASWFVTLKKFPATTLSSRPADVKTLSASKPNRVAAAVCRVDNASSEASDVSTMISVLRDSVLVNDSVSVSETLPVLVRSLILDNDKTRELFATGITYYR